MSEANGQQLPLGWAAPALGEIASINPALDHCVENDDIKVAFVPMRAVEVEGGGLTAPEVRRFGEVKNGYTSFRSGDVIMAKITPCMENGKITVVPDVPGRVCFGSTEFHSIRPEPEIQARWISWYLLQHETRRAARRQMTGAVGQMRVPAAFLKSRQIPLAPAAEQERIADALHELFSDFDAGVAALERVREKLKLYRASVLKAAVEGALTAEWRQKHPHSDPGKELLKRILAERRRRWEVEQLTRFKANDQEPPKNWKSNYKEPITPDATKLPRLPKGWCWATLDQLSSLVTSGSRAWKEYYSHDGASFIRSQDIRTDQLEIDNVAHVTPPKNSEGTRTHVRRGDLLVTITGANVAKAAVVEIELSEAYVSQHVGLIRFVEPGIGKFVHTYAVAPSGGRKKLLGSAYGAGKPGLSLDNLREMTIPLPPNRELDALVETVEDHISIIDHLEADLDAKLKTTQTLRQAILRHAFSGMLVPQDPNDEPAAKLLKRIGMEREQRASEAMAAKRSNGSRARRKLAENRHGTGKTKRREN